MDAIENDKSPAFGGTSWDAVCCQAGVVGETFTYLLAATAFEHAINTGDVKAMLVAEVADGRVESYGFNAEKNAYNFNAVGVGAIQCF